ncbi:DDE-type integrase/transposase/recombinase [Jhaorihella thermophila]
MDWHTRKVLAWRISNTLEADFRVEALNEAIHRFGPPEIMNTDQGSSSSFAWTDRLRRSCVRVSMDKRLRWSHWICVVPGQGVLRSGIAYGH